MRSALGSGTVVGLTAALVVACSSMDTTSSGSDSVSQDEADAIAKMMFVDLKSDDPSGVATQSYAFDTSLHPNAGCSPQHLTPPQACASGGNIYTTLNLTCPDASTGQCCAAKPACAKWTAAFSGQSKTLYNGCKPSPRLTLDGSLNGNLTATAEGGCAGAAAVSMTYNVNAALLAVRVDGRDVCPQGIFLTFRAFYYDHAIWSLAGNICGRQVFVTADTPPAVQCAGFGCPKGTFCGKCNQACWSTGWDDCCDGACPPGSHCVGGGKCAVP
jgi:hypothetical protein